MTKYKNKSAGGQVAKIVLFGFIALCLTIAILLRGTDVALFNPQGPIASGELSLGLLVTAVMLLIAVPTIFFFYFFAWKYRESNDEVAYEPGISNGKSLEFFIWAFPTIILIMLALILWPATFKLTPKKAIVSEAKPLTIQVIAMRWKWVFIYPEQNIATVNFIQIPTDRPVTFQLTADESSMAAFWIPHLGGMLYAMTGHVNQLNLMAETEGDYPGSSAEINGRGFAGMKFIARASSNEAYESWVQDVRLNSGVLDTARYRSLLQPSENNKVVFYNLDDPNLYDTVVMKYMKSHKQQNEESMDHSGKMEQK